MARLLVYFGILLVVLQSCIPKPGHPLEWLHREDSIIVQMKDAGGLPQPALIGRAELPDFTLYGDGTLLFIPPDQRFTSPEAGLLRATIADDEVKDLLKYVEDTGFFNFNYEQPRPDSRYDLPTTFLYVAARDEANAVSAYALSTGAPDGAEWAQFRKLEQIRQRLDAMALAAKTPAPYAPDKGVLFAVQHVADDFIGVPEWPYPAIALPNAAREEVSQVSLSAEQVASLGLEHRNATMCWNQVQYASRLYDVCYRPVLPFEENFPEFETP